MKNYKILFADLDNTITETRSGNDFPTDINDWKFKPGVIEKIYDMGINRLHIVSNQGGIEKGYFTKNDIIRKFTKIKNDILSYSNKGYCPFNVSFDFSETNRPSDRKRKPNTGMFEDFFKIYGSAYHKSDCLMIGDASGQEGNFSDSDKKAAENFDIDYMDINDFLNYEK